VKTGDIQQKQQYFLQRHFYAQHMLLIIKTAIARGIKSVIVESPEHEIEDACLDEVLSGCKGTGCLEFFSACTWPQEKDR
jgi:hypothetical protein